MGSEVILGEVTACLLRGARDASGYLALVESVGASFGDGRDRGRQVHLVKQLTGDWGLALSDEGGQFAEFGVLAVNPASPGELSWTAVQTYADRTSVEWSGPKGSKTPGPVVTIMPVAK